MMNPSGASLGIKLMKISGGVKIIIGLGNPGKKYQKTRHNVGFLILNEFLKKNHLPRFKLSKKFKSLISKIPLNGKKVILAKPQTFINDSGKAAKLLTRYYALDPKNLIIIHDDIDLPLEKIRISKGRGAAGHKGVQSIISELKTKNFIRFRVGIKPKTYNLKPKTLESFVLQKFNKKEVEIIKETIKKSTEAIETILKEGLEKTMNKFNK